MCCVQMIIREVVVVLVMMLVVGEESLALRITKREILDDNLQNYLTRFGYMTPSQDGAFALRTENSVREAIKEMQTFAGIPATGQLDENTQKLLKKPRCGLPDKITRHTGSSRTRRFALQGQKWPFTNLSWSLRSRNLNLNSYEVRSTIKKALELWAKHSTLTFTEVDSDRADILIYFHRGEHGDNFPFDGKGVILAHAFFPNSGSSIDVHFDADETWTTLQNDEGTNLFNVAAHEFGHSLGLSHSAVEGSLMYPWYTDIENSDTYELPDDDKFAIQSLYGTRDHGWVPLKPTKPPRIRPTTVSTTTSTTTTTARPTRASTRPTYPWRRLPPKKMTPMPPKKGYTKFRHYPPFERTTQRYPDKRQPTHHHPSVKEGLPRAPDTCDTGYDAVSVIRREVFFFKDRYFWRIGENGRLSPEYPAEIRRLWNQLPTSMTHVDAVYERPDGRIVFFLGRHYYVFRGSALESGYPKPLTSLGLPASLRKIDGAMVWGHNSKTYFYSGNLYWGLDDRLDTVELDYPRDISMWKGVGVDIDAVFQWKDRKTYFFKGKKFWRFDDMKMQVERDYPKSAAQFWMGCANNIEGGENERMGKNLPLKNEQEARTSGSSSSSRGGNFGIVLVLVVALLHCCCRRVSFCY